MKPLIAMYPIPDEKVAPRAGAWIETKTAARVKPKSKVAPRAGAWIETAYSGDAGSKSSGRPSRRGVD